MNDRIRFTKLKLGDTRFTEINILTTDRKPLDAPAAEAIAYMAAEKSTCSGDRDPHVGLFD
jgi:hypothetical protein